MKWTPSCTYLLLATVSNPETFQVSSITHGSVLAYCPVLFHVPVVVSLLSSNLWKLSKIGLETLKVKEPLYTCTAQLCNNILLRAPFTWFVYFFGNDLN